MKTIEEHLDDAEWLDKAAVYAYSKNIKYLDFSDEEFWLDYKNNYNLTPEEAVDDYLSDY